MAKPGNDPPRDLLPPAALADVAGGGSVDPEHRHGLWASLAHALHGFPFDGPTLRPDVVGLEKPTGVETHRIPVDKGYRGHNHPQKFRVWISGPGASRPHRKIKRRPAAGNNLALLLR